VLKRQVLSKKEERRNIETVRLMWASIQDPATRDFDSYEALLHVDHVWTSDTVRVERGQFTTAGQRLELRGPTFARTLMEYYAAAFPDLFFDQIQNIVEADTVVSRWHATGTHRGDFLGIAPTDRLGDIKGTSWYKVIDGKIVSTDVYWDVSVLLRQMGWEGWSGPRDPVARVPFSTSAHQRLIERYPQEIELIMEIIGVPAVGPSLMAAPPSDSSHSGKNLKEVGSMSNFSRWTRPFGNYRTAELRVMKFPNWKESDRATLLCWEDPDLRGVPRRYPDGKQFIVPEEAVALFKAKGIRFKVDTLLDQADLSPERRTELRREYGL